MTGAVSKITAIRVANGDDAARKVVVKALVKAEGVRRDAAAALGVSVPTLYRAIEDLDLWKTIDEACKDFPQHRGRERGPVGDEQ